MAGGADVAPSALSGDFDVGDYVRKAEGARFEGEVMTLYHSRAGVPMAVVEIVGGPFAGMQHIYRRAQLRRAAPSTWFGEGDARRVAPDVVRLLERFEQGVVAYERAPRGDRAARAAYADARAALQLALRARTAAPEDARP